MQMPANVAEFWQFRQNGDQARRAIQPTILEPTNAGMNICVYWSAPTAVGDVAAARDGIWDWE
jgi:hypothetical protein